jgi:hypothetical protein
MENSLMVFTTQRSEHNKFKMTKFNWERANQRDRLRRHSFFYDELIQVNKEKTQFDIENKQHNPLDLYDGDCNGRVPSEEKRQKIFNYLNTHKNNYVDFHLEIKDITKISSKEFARFSHQLSQHLPDLTERDILSGSLMPIAVCFSIFYLNAYNLLSGKKKEYEVNGDVLNWIKETRRTNP